MPCLALIPEDTWGQISNYQTHKCLKANVNERFIYTWPCANNVDDVADSYQWKLTDNGQILNEKTRMCLGIEGHGLIDGAMAALQNCTEAEKFLTEE